MAVSGRFSKPFLTEEGQSVMEFLFIVPMIVALVMLLFRVNSAIQISIVNQQYARAQALFISYNSAIYPHIATRVRELDGKKYNQMLMGVARDQTGVKSEIFAPTYDLNPKIQGRDEPGEPESGRTKVRVRGTVHLCTQLNYVRTVSGKQPLLELSLSGDRVNNNVTSTWAWNEKPGFAYCDAPEGMLQ